VPLLRRPRLSSVLQLGQLSSPIRSRYARVVESHQKRVKHFEEERHVHELTFSCLGRLPLLDNDLWRVWFCEELDAACERHAFLLLAYVLMPEHVVCPTRHGPRIGRLLADIKRQFSRRVKHQLLADGSLMLNRLTVRQRPGVTTFRFWQEGPGYDRNLTEARAIATAIDYIHANPVRRGLCQRAVEWPWSSARRLITNGSLDDVPRLARFEASLLVVEQQRSSEEHC
jgi:putative transposase